ncbi:MAG: hypothetical protein F4X59_15000 [Holophagales bacterium]|nr:hypothetical protein [Holophagales bacterium]MYC11420.1 hypothetical protein [Holophagales bacterium]
MAVGRFELLLPFLEALSDTPRHVGAVCDELARKHPRDAHGKVHYEGRWAASALFRSGFADRPRRGFYRLNRSGKDLLRRHPTVDDVSQIVNARYKPRAVDWRRNRSEAEARSARGTATATSRKATTLDEVHRELDSVHRTVNDVKNRLDGIEKATRATEARLDSVENRLEAVEATLAKVDERTLAIKRAVLSRPYAT